MYFVKMPTAPWVELGFVVPTRFCLGNRLNKQSCHTVHGSHVWIILGLLWLLPNKGTLRLSCSASSSFLDRDHEYITVNASWMVTTFEEERVKLVTNNHDKPLSWDGDPERAGTGQRWTMWRQEQNGIDNFSITHFYRYPLRRLLLGHETLLKSKDKIWKHSASGAVSEESMIVTISDLKMQF